MDYDATEMPAVFDAGRGYSPYQMQFWLDRISNALGKSSFDKILDVGCGTGRFTGPLSEHFSAQAIGIEPSEKMLVEARRKLTKNIEFVQGAAEYLPIDDGLFDLVFLSMVLHHFTNPRAAILEFGRVLKPGGLVALRAGTTEQISGYPYISFFPTAPSIFQRTLLPASGVVELFAGGGLALVRHMVVESPVAMNECPVSGGVAGGRGGRIGVGSCRPPSVTPGLPRSRDLRPAHHGRRRCAIPCWRAESPSAAPRAI